ncbi:uncharacterized protein [Paramisgurnus dabryanus]|uniref:uncharacterized protein n=1 Tax=Paramisgurnus dabryanus TaxID=90735 RepID=UPI0031F3B8C8
MNLLPTFLLMILTGHSMSEYVQSISCPYPNESKNESRTRVWCKRDVQDENCCTGLAFRSGIDSLDNGQILVKQDEKSFTVSMLALPQGEGVYWCGLMDTDNTIVKLAEKYFSTPLNYVWSILRWIMFLLMFLMFISTYIYINRKNGNAKKTNEDTTYEDIRMQVKE